MATRRRIETGAEIWRAALEDTPLDMTGPQWSEERPVNIWPILILALLANAAFSILSVKVWDFLF